MATPMKGIVVKLATKNTGNSGTDDQLYVGIMGTGGGREFPLDSSGDDFEPGTTRTYWLGSVWEGGVLSGAIKPFQSEIGQANDPARLGIDMDKVDHVYLRKAGTTGDDDAWQLNRIDVHLYGDNSPEKRSFVQGDDIWLGHEFGQQVWLKPSLRIRLPNLEVKTNGAVNRLQAASEAVLAD